MLLVEAQCIHSIPDIHNIHHYRTSLNRTSMESMLT
jgi:hypothetical protein